MIYNLKYKVQALRYGHYFPADWVFGTVLKILGNTEIKSNNYCYNEKFIAQALV